MKTKGKATDIDKLIGKRLKVLRELRGLSQVELSEKINITYQQIQKYESGINRVSAGMLYKMSQVLEFSFPQIFEELPFQEIEMIPSCSELHKIIRNWSHITDINARKSISYLIETRAALSSK